MKKMIMLCSLFSVVGFVSGQPAVDMSRIYAEEAQVQKAFNERKPAREKALKALWQTEKGKIYKRESDKSENTRWNKSSEYMQAEADLRATKEYQNEFLPVEKDTMYHDWKLFGLEKMIRYVRARVGRSDIEAMYSGLHSALHVDTCPNVDLRATRDQVYNELRGLIKLEDRILGIEEAKGAMPEYQ